MAKYLLLFIAFLTALFAPHDAHAYIDPGTTSSAFGLIATIISGIGVMLAFLIRPIKQAILSIRKKRQAPGTPERKDTPPTTNDPNKPV